ncbi:MAG: alanine racemase, partial [Anaerolineaceae bacterium]
MNIGDNLYDLETPALWVDLDTMERNIQLMAKTMRDAGVNWRPHTKGIKIPAIAQMLLNAGAMGITCAKITEAEFMAAAGIKDILIGNQVVGRTKIARLIALQSKTPPTTISQALKLFLSMRKISLNSKAAPIRSLTARFALTGGIRIV